MKKTFALALLISAQVAMATTNALPALLIQYPEIGASPLADCMTCHTIDKWQRNDFGKDLQAWLRANDPRPEEERTNQYGNRFYSGEFISQGLTAIEDLDSDGDGVLNIEEFENFTFPGDAQSF